MPGLSRKLAQARPSGTSAVSLFNPNYDEFIEIGCLNVCNTGASAIKVSAFDSDATTYDETTALFWQVELQPGSVLMWEPPKGGIWSNAANIGVQTDTANDATFTLYGKTDTETLEKLRGNEGV